MKPPDIHPSTRSRRLHLAMALVVLIGAALLYWRRHIANVQTPAKTDIAKPIASPPAVQTVSATAAPVVDEFGKGPYGYLLNSDIERAYHSAKKLHLSPAQLAYMQSRYNVFLDRLKQLEARVAVKDQVKPGEALITVPPHNEAAMALYSQFEREMAVYLGADQATEFFDECGQTIAMFNRDFGAKEQLILVDRNDTDGTFHIVDKTSWTTNPDLPAGVTAGPATSCMISDLNITGNMYTYKYLAADFP